MDNPVSRTQTTKQQQLGDSIGDSRGSLQRNVGQAVWFGNASPMHSGSWCPNCGALLEGRKCKLFCHTPGCGYLVTCSEW